MAPWNLHRHQLTKGIYADHPFVDGHPLILFHFSSLRFAPYGTVVQLANADYQVEQASGAVELIYRPYLDACAAGAREG